MTDPRLVRYRTPGLVFAVYLLLQAVSAAALFELKLGGGADGVRVFFLGSEERFTAAKSLAGVLEVAVPHLLALPLVLFAAVHVVGFARALPPRLFSALVALSFGSALLGILASFGVRFVAPGFAWLKVLAFAGLEAALLSCAALLCSVFVPWRSARSADREARSAPQEVAP